MIPRQKAQKLLLDSLSDLEKRNNYLSPDDYGADIINVTCQYFIDNGFDYISGPNAMAYFQNNYMELRKDVETFIGSISSNYPHIVTAQNIQNMAQNVCLNLGWDGMPAFLNDYFYKKHGKKENDSSEHYEFSSSSHIRYEYGNLVTKSNVDRQISLAFMNDKRNMRVCITPSLSLKEAILKSRSEQCFVYEGVDPDYQFKVEFDEFDDVCRFSLELKSRQLKLEYFE